MMQNENELQFNPDDSMSSFNSTTTTGVGTELRRSKRNITNAFHTGTTGDIAASRNHHAKMSRKNSRAKK
jgi:hypothetical protein